MRMRVCVFLCALLLLTGSINSQQTQQSAGGVPGSQPNLFGLRMHNLYSAKHSIEQHAIAVLCDASDLS
jgi:hypothetical protein